MTVEGESFIEGEVRLVKPMDPTTRDRLLKEWRERFPYISAMPDNIPMPGGGVFAISGLPRFVSPKEAAQYSAKVDGVFAKFKRYLDDWHSIINRYVRSLELKFRVENSGTAPADVHITLWTDADGAWLAKLPDPPKPPVLRKARNPLEFPLTARMHQKLITTPCARSTERTTGPTLVRTIGNASSNGKGASSIMCRVNSSPFTPVRVR